MLPKSNPMDSLGLVETKNIATGVTLLDTMLKAAEVDLLRAGSICSGRYLIRITGDRDGVETAVAEVNDAAGIVDAFVLSRVDDQIIQAFQKSIRTVAVRSALGLVEAKRAAAGIIAADAAVKKANVTLARLAVANGINGKSYVVLNGDTSSVGAGVEAACEVLANNLLDYSIIPNPDIRVQQALFQL